MTRPLSRHLPKNFWDDAIQPVTHESVITGFIAGSFIAASTFGFHAYIPF